jgi:hypothetical protein
MQRIHDRLDYLEEMVGQLMAIKRHCARGEYDLKALDAAIRWGMKLHSNKTSWLLRKKRNCPTLGKEVAS